MSSLQALEHTLVWHRPETNAEVFEAWNRAAEFLGDEDCAAYVTGWWQEETHEVILYPSPTAYIVNATDDWLVTDNRRHRLSPLPLGQGAACAVEFVPTGKAPAFRYALADLAEGSPLGYALTRMRPGWDIIGCDDPAPFREYAEMEPDPETLRSVRPTPSGAILECPTHTIEVDRLWHRLARQAGLVAERDIEAYAIGWWQERDYRGGPHGAVNLAFSTPQQIWGFHHPPGAPKARWMYLDAWPIDTKPLPASSGPAWWAVEFVQRGHEPTLRAPDLTLQVPRRKLDSASSCSPAPDPLVTSRGALTSLSPVARALVEQPLPVLAGLCGLKDLGAIATFAWECAAWVTANPVDGEQWPSAHLRYWSWLWTTNQRDRYLA